MKSFRKGSIPAMMTMIRISILEQFTGLNRPIFHFLSNVHAFEKFQKVVLQKGL